MNPWHTYPVPRQRLEAWDGDRVVRCFAERPASLFALFERALHDCPAHDAVVFEAKRWTYAQAATEVARAASGFARAGVARGDRVALFISNRPEFVWVLLALQRLGAIAVPIGVREQRTGLAYMLNQCGASGVVFDASLAERIPVADEAPSVVLRVSLGEAPGALPYAVMVAGDAAAPDPVAVAEHETAVILYTSGTTGHPKGAMLTHRNIAHSVMHFRACMQLRAGDRSALAVPASQQRSLVYQRAKGDSDKRPFGTQLDVHEPGYEWINHSLQPTALPSHDFRIHIGGERCTQPYSASLFNISAMSFGALSANAIMALNGGARRGGFAHDTGEGSISEHHRLHGGDLIWEIGSGYFGCRNDDGSFNETKFQANARDPQVKLIELKLSQGAKPGHGGMLPGPKVSAEIAAARGVPVGVDCLSPAAHSAFGTPLELLQFLDRLRGLSGGKPVGFKLCIGHPWEWLALAKAMVESDLLPDFIVVDGAEGGSKNRDSGLGTER